MVKRLEQGMIDMAKTLGYKAVICLNSSPVTQHVAVHELGYERLETIQVNKYISLSSKMYVFITLLLSLS